MALSNPRAFYGIHSVAPYRRTDNTPYGILRVLGDSSLSLTGELVSLNGGSNKYPWVVEDGLITAELALTFREYPDWVFELFLGASVTANAAQATGSVSAIENVSGTSIVDAATGIDSVAATGADEADLKFATYVVKATGANTVDIFASTNVDFGQGTNASFEGDDLSILASDITIPDTGGTVAVADFGLTFTGGSGTIAFTTGDSAKFQVKPINTGSSDITVGASASVFPSFGAFVVAAKRGSFEMVEFDLFNVKAVGLPIGLTENAFSEASVTAQAFYDSERDGVFAVRTVKASA